MSDNFNGSAINVVAPDVPDDITAAVSVRLMPGATGTPTNYIDIGGVQSPGLTLTLFFSQESDYQAFKTNVGVLATLVYDEFPAGVLAVLESLKRQMRNVGTVNETKATAEFVLAT